MQELLGHDWAWVSGCDPSFFNLLSYDQSLLFVCRLVLDVKMERNAEALLPCSTNGTSILLLPL